MNQLKALQSTVLLGRRSRENDRLQVTSAVSYNFPWLLVAGVSCLFPVEADSFE
jgi:hypothetical protein